MATLRPPRVGLSDTIKTITIFERTTRRGKTGKPEPGGKGSDRIAAEPIPIETQFSCETEK